VGELQPELADVLRLLTLHGADRQAALMGGAAVVIIEESIRYLS
jgi:hypothetical protein